MRFNGKRIPTKSSETGACHETAKEGRRLPTQQSINIGCAGNLRRARKNAVEFECPMQII